MVAVGLDVGVAAATGATGASLAIISTPKNSSSFRSANCWSCSHEIDHSVHTKPATASNRSTYTHAHIQVINKKRVS